MITTVNSQANKTTNWGKNDLEIIKMKFENCLSKFMTVDFPMFDRDYKRIELLFISRINPYVEGRDTLQNLKFRYSAFRFSTVHTISNGPNQRRDKIIQTRKIT